MSLNRFFYLKIENVGNETAYDVRISINASFLDKMLIQDFKNFLYNLCQKKLFLPPNKVMYYLLSPIYSSSSLTIQHTSYSCQEINSNLDILINEPFVITGTYNGNRKITETLTINQCTGSVVVDSPKVQKLDDIYKELKNLTKISHLLITDEVKSVYEKARFSNHTISDDELKIIENAYYNSIEEIYNNLPRIKKPYYKFIKAIK